MTADEFHDQDACSIITMQDAPYQLRQLIHEAAEWHDPSVDPTPPILMVWGNNRTISRLNLEPLANGNERTRLSNRLSILASNQNVDAIGLAVEGRALSVGNEQTPDELPDDIIQQALKCNSAREAEQLMRKLGLEPVIGDCLNVSYETRTHIYHAICPLTTSRQLGDWKILMQNPDAGVIRGTLQGFFLNANQILLTAYNMAAQHESTEED